MASRSITMMMPDAKTLWIEALRGEGTRPTGWVFTQNKVVAVR
jgi:hypothetical protein